jgi:hypothetical protein
MSLQFMKDIRSALANLDPDHVRNAAERPLRVALAGGSSDQLAAIEDYLVPACVSREKRIEVAQSLFRHGDPGSPQDYDITLAVNGEPSGGDTFAFDFRDPQRTLREILAARQDLGLALARSFPPFRQPMVERIIHMVCRENALFAVATALPNFVPSIFELPWAAGEFASDTVVLTMNQIRMAFLIAGASDSDIGYREQKGEIASIITGAFGWRTIARELSGKIPYGGGLLPKGAIAWAGTYVVGLSLERFHRIGYGLSRAERREAYQVALERGRGVVQALIAGIRKGSETAIGGGQPEPRA